MTARLGVLLSGRGSNFLALQRAIERGELPAEIVLVAADRKAPGLEAAAALGLPTVLCSRRGRTRAAQEADLLGALENAHVDWICLAGYLRILSPSFVDRYPNRIVNIHPSLLPAFPGLDAQAQAWDYGVAVTGCTVHLVDHQLDHGPIVGQHAVAVGEASSLGALRARILEEEHQLYASSLRRLLVEDWRIDGRRLIFSKESGDSA